MRKANDAIVGRPQKAPQRIGEILMHATASVVHGTYDSTCSASSQWDAPASAEEFDRLEGDNDSDGSFVKGALVALGIEAATAFMVCSIWQIWHLIP